MPYSPLVIAARYCGPPNSGNGGYVAGLLARQLGAGPVEVTLRKPPPLDCPLSVEDSPGRLALCDGDALIAEARRASCDVAVPPAPSFEQATRMSEHYRGFSQHPFPRCFVCGPQRGEGDGLRIFPGRAPDAASEELVAAPFVTHPSFTRDGEVAPEVLWAALDCPGYFAVAAPGEAAVLGRITAVVERAVAAGEALVSVGLPLGREGRKLQAASVLFDSVGGVVARSKQTWLVIA